MKILIFKKLRPKDGSSRYTGSSRVPTHHPPKLSFGPLGFTLTETLVYLFILTVIISGILVFFLWTIRSNNKIKSMREVQDNGQRVMEIISQEIREAKNIYSPTTGSSQLSLETSKYLPQGEETSYLDFFLCENRLCFKKESADPIALTSDRVEINNLKFTLFGTIFPSVQVELGVNFKNPQNLPEYNSSINLTFTSSLRSY